MKSLLSYRNTSKLRSIIANRSSVFSTKSDAHLGASPVYVEQMYSLWKNDPSSVHNSWGSYFTKYESGEIKELAPVPANSSSITVATHVPSGLKSDSLGLSYLIRAYQTRGHEIANLDPLGVHKFRSAQPPPELDYKYHGFKEEDLDRTLNLLGTSTGGNTGFLDFLGSRPDNLTLRQVLTSLQQTYCSTLGVEYMHIQSQEKCNWIRDQVENPKWMKFSKQKKMHIFERLCFADHFEKFLGNKFNTVKRFGLDGGESCIPGLKAMVDRGSELGIESFVFGMPHRGRLSVLAHVLRKPLPQIFREFQGTHYDLDEYLRHDWSSSGDVKYHLGTSIDRTYPDGRRVHLSLVANPSHLEAVNPVAIGKVRAKQYLSGNKEEDKFKHMPILIHGDAAFAGQGIVYETIQMSRVADFAVGGTIHVIINNQIGFTTDPSNARSTLYSSDLMKAFNVPIFHCNGDDTLSVITAFEMAVEWRQKFGEDVLIDMICYRRFGHNELDQPLFTQPIMYNAIAKHDDTVTVYGKRLVNEGTCTQQDIDAIRAQTMKTLENEFEAAKTWNTPAADWLSSKWSGFRSPQQLARMKNTFTEIEKLRMIGLKICEVPEGFKVNKQLEKIMATRKSTIERGEGIDWGTAEALAIGSLLLEGNHVRLTGQDVERGTFSHRHAVLVDQITQEKHCSLNKLAKTILPTIPTSRNQMIPTESQGEFTVRNSILSEFGVLGFEMGYSLENPNVLVMWEAQFGDFVNGAQIMIDQFISAGEDKWLRQSGLTLLLPHGYMGQGAEHSSCRLERFLQQVEEDPDEIILSSTDDERQIQLCNWQVCNVTTPANYFHVLRRQLHREFRKPLIIATPKNLLREKKCTSTLTEMGKGHGFLPVIKETNKLIADQGENIRRLIFCSGKLYYELVDERDKRNITDIAIVRIEQIAPFPWDQVAKEAAYYKNAEIVWCQEEPKNMGAFSYVHPRIATATRTINHNEKWPKYIGRKPSAATATGLGGRAHNAEQAAILESAFAPSESV